MATSLDVLEAEMTDLRARIRSAFAADELSDTITLRAELVRAEQAWHTLVQIDDSPVLPTVSAGRGAATAVRDRVHQVLTLLAVPAAPRLINQVCQSLWGVELGAATSLPRDEKRSWRAAPDARAFYVTPTLHHGTLRPVRALLTLSTWPLEQRIAGPMSPLLHRLIVAARVAEALGRLDVAPAGQSELLAGLASDIPGALPLGTSGPPAPRRVQDAAELALRNYDSQTAADSLIRREAALRLAKLTAAERLFGAGAPMPDKPPAQHTP